MLAVTLQLLITCLSSPDIGQISSFIYLHDISQTKQIFLASAKTYVKQKNESAFSEFSFCSIDSNEFELLEGNEDDDTYFHKSKKIQVIQFFEQKQNPVELYHHQVGTYPLYRYSR